MGWGSELNVFLAYTKRKLSLKMPRLSYSYCATHDFLNLKVDF